MNFIPSRLVLFLNLAAFTTLFFSCTKITNTDIGSGLIPPADGVKTKDTILDVITKNVNFDTVAVGFSDDHVLGYISNDPVFGATSAGINFQVDLPYADYSFGSANDKNDIKFDSAVLSLKYTGVWGDSTKPLAIHVYEMDPENLFSADSSYPNTKSFEKGGEITANGVAKNVDITTLNDPDTIQTNSQYYEDATGQIRIQLSQAFGEKLLKQYDSTNAYVDDSTFHNYLKGFIVEVEQQGNALVRINLADTGTRLSLYYRFPSTTTTGAEDTAVRRFTASSVSCASSNTIIRKYNGTAVPNYLPSNSNTQDSILFIQTSPGIYARIQIPGLGGLQNMIVHRSELLMQQIPDATSSSDDIFTAPDLFVAAYSKDSAKRFAVPNDVVYSSGVIGNLTSFGVNPIVKTDPLTGKTQRTYSFDLSRYTQGVVSRKDSTYDLILWAPYNYYMSDIEATPYAYPISTPALNPAAIGRVRLGGGNNTQYRMRLHVVYSLP